MSVMNFKQDRARAEFHARFQRCYQMLHFIAYRVLGDHERAERAVENGWHTAFCNLRQFEYEGAFRSWLLRVVIDEALAILRDNQETHSIQSVARSRSTQVLRRESMQVDEIDTWADDHDWDGHKFFVARE